MPSITYQLPSGVAQTVEVPSDTSVMLAALSNSVEGIIGECGGQMMCATCHVYVRSDAALPEVSDDEDAMLDCTAEDRLDNSRLGCQLVAGRDFDALAVEVPRTQN